MFLYSEGEDKMEDQNNAEANGPTEEQPKQMTLEEWKAQQTLVGF